MKRFLALLFLFVCISTIIAADPKYSSDQWLSSYFRNPQPDRFVEEVRAMSSGGYFSKQSSQPPLIAFLGRVMAQNPGKIEGWMKALDDLPVSDRDVMYAALWFSGTEEGKRSLAARGIKDYDGKNPPVILTMEIDSPTVIDMLWAWYFATGDEKAVRRVISAFNLSEHEGAMERFKSSKKTQQDKQAAYQDLAFKSAQWSLADNCSRFPEVKGICEKLYSGNALNKTENLWLGVILAKVVPGKYKVEPGSTQWTENGKPVSVKPNVNSKDGFSIMLYLTDDPRLFDGRSKRTVTSLDPLTKARRGIPVYVTFLLSDPGVDATGAADLTFDMVVRKPGGEIFAQKNGVVCWKGKYDVPAHQLQFAKGYLGIRINPGDLPGIYTVEAIVRDNVKTIELPVKATFEVP